MLTVKHLINELSLLPADAVVEVWHDSPSEEGVISKVVDVLGYNTTEHKVIIRVRDERFEGIIYEGSIVERSGRVRPTHE